MGAALTGGVGVGLYPNFEMGEQMNPIMSEVQPSRLAQAAYDKVYPIFEAAYHALSPIYDMIDEADLSGHS